MRIDDVKAAANKAGIAYRGGFHPAADDLPENDTAQTLILLGFIGGEQWAGFAASPEYKDGKPHPLDRWSLRIVGALSRALGAKAYFPFTAPFMPFIKWAQKAEAVAPSEIGMLIHPCYGLWHSWRGALAFDEKIDLPQPDTCRSPCETCVEKPCLSACPVGAFSGAGEYDVSVCAKHIRSENDTACMEGGCLARRACPIGAQYRYGPEQAMFHMKSFRGG